MGDMSLNSVWEKALKLNIKMGIYNQLHTDGLLADFQYKKLCQKILTESLDFARQQSHTEQQPVEVTEKKPEFDGCCGEEGEVYLK